MSAKQSLQEWADKQDTYVTEKLTRHGEQGTYAAIRANIDHHLPAIEAEACAELRTRITDHEPTINGDISDSTWLACSCGWEQFGKHEAETFMEHVERAL